MLFGTEDWKRAETVVERVEESYVCELLMDSGIERPGLAPYVSVDTASVGEARYHFCVMDKLPLVDHFLETGGIAPSRLDADILETVLDCVDRALDALGVTQRVTHTEVRLTSSGPQVIEVNGRLGGSVYQAVLDLTRKSAADAAIVLATGKTPNLASLREFKGASLTVCGLLFPFAAADPELVTRAAIVLGACEGVTSARPRRAISTGFRTVMTWIRADGDAALNRFIQGAVDAVCNDSLLSPVVPSSWRLEIAALGAT